MRQSVKQALILLAKVLLAAALIYWLVQKKVLQFEHFSALAAPGFLSILASLVFIMIFMNNYRWQLLLQAQDVPAQMRATLPLSFIGMFFNFAMPGGVGGDVIKGYYLLQDFPQKKLPAALSIFMDRIVGFFIMVLTAAIALAFNWEEVMRSPQFKAVASGVLLLLVAFTVFFTLALSRRLRGLTKWIYRLPGGHVIQRISDGIHAYRAAPQTLLWSFALSAFSQTMMIIFVILVGERLHPGALPYSAYFFLVPVGLVVTALPISPAGVGVGQTAFYFLFSLYVGSDSAIGPTAITGIQILQFAWGLVGAYFYLTRKSVKAMAPLSTNV